MSGGKGFNGHHLVTEISDQTDQVVIEQGGDTYIAVAKPGTPEDTAKWLCWRVRIHAAGGGGEIKTTIRYAIPPHGGNKIEFNQKASELQTLTYD